MRRVLPFMRHPRRNPFMDFANNGPRADERNVSHWQHESANRHYTTGGAGADGLAVTAPREKRSGSRIPSLLAGVNRRLRRSDWSLLQRGDVHEGLDDVDCSGPVDVGRRGTRSGPPAQQCQPQSGTGGAPNVAQPGILRASGWHCAPPVFERLANYQSAKQQIGNWQSALRGTDYRELR